MIKKNIEYIKYWRYIATEDKFMLKSTTFILMHS